jgi:transposase
MVNKKYMVHLTEEDRGFLQQFTSTGKRSAREFLRGMILLLADKGKTDEEIHEILNVSTCTIQRTRQKYATDGLDSALYELPRPGQPKKLSSAQEQQIIAIACSTAPEGRSHWTLELLKEEAINRGIVDEISTGPIRILLKEHNLKPWKKKMWCIPELTDEYIKRMMDILEVYERPLNPENPVICFDEKSKQLLAHTRDPLPAAPGTPERYDSEYERRGTSNIFVMVEPKAGNRHTLVRKRRTYKEYSLCMKYLTKMYRNAEKIILVQDNLNTHTEKSDKDISSDLIPLEM